MSLQKACTKTLHIVIIMYILVCGIFVSESYQSNDHNYQDIVLWIIFDIDSKLKQPSINDCVVSLIVMVGYIPNRINI